MKRLILFLVICLISLPVFARIGDIKLDNVQFNGRIENIGTSTKPSDVTILRSPDGSKYIISGSYINNLTIGGSGTFVISNCTIWGQVVIKDNPKVYIGYKDIPTSTNSNVDDENTKTILHVVDDESKIVPAAINGREMKGGEVYIGRAYVSTPDKFTIDFQGSGITVASINKHWDSHYTYSYPMGTGSASVSKHLKAIDFKNCTSLTTFVLCAGLYVRKLDLSGCTSLGKSVLTDNSLSMASASRWDITGTENGEGLFLQEMGISGELELANNKIYRIDLSDNNVENKTMQLTLSGNNLRYVKASGSSITYANITMDATNNQPVLDLSDNKLSENTTVEWTVVNTEKDHITMGDTAPSDFVEKNGIRYYNENPRKDTTWITCQTCGGDGWVMRGGGDEIYEEVPVEEVSARDYDLKNTYPNGYWGTEVVWHFGQEYRVFHTGEVTSGTGEPCEVCCNPDGSMKWPSQGYVEAAPCWYSTLVTKKETTDLGLVINGKQIHTKYNGGGNVDGTVLSDLYMDFASEWDGLSALNVDLRNNGICYKAGFKSGRNGGTWTITFDVKMSDKIKTGNKVAVLDDKHGRDDGNPNDSFTGKFIINTDGQNDIAVRTWTSLSSGEAKIDYAKGSKNETTTSTSGTLKFDAGSKVTFKNYRSQAVFWSADYMGGAIMEIYPFL